MNLKRNIGEALILAGCYLLCITLFDLLTAEKGKGNVIPEKTETGAGGRQEAAQVQQQAAHEAQQQGEIL